MTIEILGSKVNADLAVAELLLLDWFVGKCFCYYRIEVQEETEMVDAVILEILRWNLKMVVWKEESNPNFLKDWLDDTELLLDEPLDGSR